MPPAHIAVAKVVADAALRELPEAILDASGRALYSPASTLSSGSPIYFLGLNPGEAPDGIELHSSLTVRDDLDRLANDTISLHGYLDEKWKTNDPGIAPIQVAGQQVFSILARGSSEDGERLLRRSPTSNFILQRSPAEADLQKRTGMKPSDLAEQCWPFHQAVLKATGCRFVLTHAVGIARSFARSRGLGEGWKRPSGWGGTLNTLYAWDLPDGTRLLAMPNLSRYKPDGPRTVALARFFEEFGPIVISE